MNKSNKHPSNICPLIRSGAIAGIGSAIIFMVIHDIFIFLERKRLNSSKIDSVASTSFNYVDCCSSPQRWEDYPSKFVQQGH